jgi:inosine-uridine nucleoside N-ribohydrolase
MASNKYEGVAAVLNVFNTYFRRPEIPIGVPRGDAVDQRDTQHWTDTILAKYPHTIKLNSEVPDAVGLYRKILAMQPDRSVTIITVGFLTNLRGLLQSGPDEYSPMGGTDLVKRKVVRLVSMAGKFPSGREFNIFRDIGASRYVFSNWPTIVLFSGFEIGQQIKCGLPLVNNEAIKNSPVKDVFRISLPLAEEDHMGRMSWDETAVLAAMNIYVSSFGLKQGHIKIEVDGSNTWQDDGEGQFHLVERGPLSAVQQTIDVLMMHQPAK